MSSSSSHAPMKAEAPRSLSLNYLQSSPVRGQLEPYDPRANKGFPGRFLQCTDTPNQLRVLLPPSTAEFYEQLLKYEASELAKNPPISWDRILEIRHLKDRMIRKCQKLCKTSAPRRLGRGESFAFQTFIAPPDFRLKEMEKWLKHQPDRMSTTRKASILSVTSRGRPNPTCCDRCDQGQPHRVPSASSVSSPESVHVPLDRSPSPSVHPPIPIPEPSLPMPVPEPFSHQAQFEPPSAAANVSMPRTDAFSPEPLPHPYRGSIELGPGDFSAFAPPLNEPTLPTHGQEKYIPPPLRRRRSCIKQPSKDSIKTVSWADNKDWSHQVSRYAAAVDDAHASGQKGEDIIAVYSAQMSGLDGLLQDVVQSMERIRAETDHLRSIESAILEQRNKVKTSLDEYANKQGPEGQGPLPASMPHPFASGSAEIVS